MLSSLTQQTIQGHVNNLEGFYRDSSRGSFSGSNKIQEYSEDERKYFFELTSLSKITGYDEKEAFHAMLSEKSKTNFALYILHSGILPIDVKFQKDKKTVFQLLVEIFIEKPGMSGFGNYLLALYNWGYAAQESDQLFIRDLYKAIGSQQELETWCIARFALLLNDSDLLETALQHQMSLFTIASFKLKKPVGIHYPNLLGIANNAFLHYRENGDILLQAMKHYDVYNEVIKRDQKKTFDYRLKDFEMYKPIQNVQFKEIVSKIFPELQNAHRPIPQVGQNL